MASASYDNPLQKEYNCLLLNRLAKTATPEKSLVMYSMWGHICFQGPKQNIVECMANARGVLNNVYLTKHIKRGYSLVKMGKSTCCQDWQASQDEAHGSIASALGGCQVAWAQCVSCSLHNGMICCLYGCEVGLILQLRQDRGRKVKTDSIAECQPLETLWFWFGFLFHGVWKQRSRQEA